jgi:hypothetical protein
VYAYAASLCQCYSCLAINIIEMWLLVYNMVMHHTCRAKFNRKGASGGYLWATSPWTRTPWQRNQAQLSWLQNHIHFCCNGPLVEFDEWSIIERFLKSHDTRFIKGHQIHLCFKSMMHYFHFSWNGPSTSRKLPKSVLCVWCRENDQNQPLGPFQWACITQAAQHLSEKEPPVGTCEQLDNGQGRPDKGSLHRSDDSKTMSTFAGMAPYLNVMNGPNRGVSEISWHSIYKMASYSFAGALYLELYHHSANLGQSGHRLMPELIRNGANVWNTCDGPYTSVISKAWHRSGILRICG